MNLPCRRPRSGIYGKFHFLQGCILQEEAVSWQEMTSRCLRWLEVTRKWRYLTGNHQKVAAEGRKLAYTVHFTTYKAEARRRRQTRGGKWCHVTSGDRKWPRSDSFDRKSPGSGCRGLKTGIYCTFHFLQGCSSQEKAVTWQEKTSRDLRLPEEPGSDVIWPEVTLKRL